MGTEPQGAGSMQSIVQDPEFLNLPEPEQIKVFSTLDKDFAGLPPAEQSKALGALKGSKQDYSAFRPVGMVATGFNKGLGSFVDLINDGLKAVGLPMSDEPFLGSAWVDKYLSGSQYTPKNAMESVMHRAGFEMGATVPILGVSLAARGARLAATEAPKAMPDASFINAVKQVPSVMVDQMMQIPPAKLAVLEMAIAGGAGTTGEIVHQAFPEGGPAAEFVGELLGSFAPSVVLGMVQRAHRLATNVVVAGRAAVGLETEEDTKARLAKQLKPLATEQEVQAGVEKAAALRKEVSPTAEPGSGLELSAGEAINEPVASWQRALSRTGNAEFQKKAADRQQQNIEAVKSYFDATAPDGNPTHLVETLEQQRMKERALLDLGLQRTEAKLNAMKQNVSARAARLQMDLESRMQAADQRIEQRLIGLRGTISKKERGELIRQEYDRELARFREQSSADYRELDNLGHAEIPVESTLSSLRNLEAQFPSQVQIIQKVSPTIAKVLETLGHDYELQLRAQKGLDDLGVRDASGKGVKIFHDDGTVTGLSRGTPQWYKDLTTKPKSLPGAKGPTISQDISPLTRDTVVRRLQRVAQGQRLNPDDPIDEEIRKALLSDGEFRNSPYNEPVLQHLTAQTPSGSLSDLRQVRSDLLRLSRNAKATNDSVQRYVVNELIQGVDRDIDQLLPGASPFADVYPSHGELYRQVSADYRAGTKILFSGTNNKIRAVDRYGNSRMYDEDVAKQFWRNETTVQEFEKTFPNNQEAMGALRQEIIEDFTSTVVKRKGDDWVLDQPAYEQWMKDHAAQLKTPAAVALKAHLEDTAAMLKDAKVLREEAALYEHSRKGEQAVMETLHRTRMPGDVTAGDITAQEARLQRIADLQTRSTQEWERSVAGLYLKVDPDYAAQRVVTSRTGLQDYLALRKQVEKDPDAVAGLNKSIWNAITQKMQARFVGMTGQVNLGVFHKELQQMLTGYRPILEQVLGAEGLQRVKTANDAVERIARGGKAGSDTKMNFSVPTALASTWLSRAFGVASGRVPKVFAGTERASQMMIKYFQGMTLKQQDEILLESFFNPEVYQTLIMAGERGATHPEVMKRTRIHLQLLNLSEQRDEP